MCQNLTYQNDDNNEDDDLDNGDDVSSEYDALHSLQAKYFAFDIF